MRWLLQADDRLGGRQFAFGAGADADEGDVLEVLLRFLEALFGARDQRFGELQRGGAVDEAADRRVAESGDGFLVGGIVGEGLAGGGFEAEQGLRHAVADRDAAFFGGEDQRLGTEFGAVHGNAARLAAEDADPLDVEGPHQGHGAFDRFQRLVPFGGEDERAAEAAYAVAGGEYRRFLQRFDQPFQVDAEFLDPLLQLVRRDRARDAFGVEAVEHFLHLVAEAGGGERREGGRGQRAEQARGVAARRLLAAEVAAEVDLDLVGAGDDAGDRGSFAGVDAGVLQDPLRLRGDFAARFFDQPADVDVRVGEAAVGRGGDRLREAVFAGERFAVGGVDDVLEDLFPFGLDEKFAAAA